MSDKRCLALIGLLVVASLVLGYHLIGRTAFVASLLVVGSLGSFALAWVFGSNQSRLEFELYKKPSPWLRDEVARLRRLKSVLYALGLVCLFGLLAYLLIIVFSNAMHRAFS